MIDHSHQRIVKMEENKQINIESDPIFINYVEYLKEIKKIFQDLLFLQFSNKSKNSILEENQILMGEESQLVRISQLFLDYYGRAQKAKGITLKTLYLASYYIFQSFENQLFFFKEINTTKERFLYEVAEVTRW